MTYFGSLGDVTADDFVTVGGVCKPRNFATLDKFKEFQRQLNRGAQAKGLAKIAVDGDIGPGTVKLLALVQAGAQMSCAAIAGVSEGLTAQVKAVADQAGVPSSVSSPKPATTPAIVAPSGAIVPQPASSSVLDAFGNMGTTEKILAVAILGGGAYLLLTKKKRRK